MGIKSDDQIYFISPGAKAVAGALESWNWIGVSGKNPFLITAFADVFLESTDGVWFLDTLEGTLEIVCETKLELDQILATEAGKDRYLLTGFIDRAIREAKVLKDDECYDFKIHPIVGGPIEYSNIGKISFPVALHIRGQLHDQVRHLTPGTRISKFTFETENKPKVWWKFWS